MNADDPGFSPESPDEDFVGRETSLLKRALQHDRLARDELWSIHAQALERSALADLSRRRNVFPGEDLSGLARAVAWLAFQQGIETYDAEHGTSFRTWCTTKITSSIWTLARRGAKNIKREPTLHDFSWRDERDPVDPAEEAIRSERRRRVRFIVSLLVENEQTVLGLRYFEFAHHPHPLKQTARFLERALGWSERETHSSLRQAQRRFQAEWIHYYGSEEVE